LLRALSKGTEQFTVTTQQYSHEIKQCRNTEISTHRGNNSSAAQRGHPADKHAFKTNRSYRVISQRQQHDQPETLKHENPMQLAALVTTVDQVGVRSLRHFKLRQHL